MGTMTDKTGGNASQVNDRFGSAQELFDALCEPFPTEYIEWRLGSTNKEKMRGLALAYIDARAVMDRLDGVCGPDGWQNNYLFGPGSAIICNLGVRMPSGDWIWKADGAGATDVEAEKGAMSDALKRSAVRFGVGRYLYELKSPWVTIEPYGKSFKIADSEFKKLDDIHDDHAHKAGWGNRAGVQAYKVLNQAVKQWVRNAADAAEFEKKNESMIVQLPVSMRKHFLETLHRIGAPDMRMAG